MIYLEGFNYSYTPEQYEGVDLNAQDIVEARYTKVSGHAGNADIEALPVPLPSSELMTRSALVPDALIGKDTDPIARVWALRALRIPLRNQHQIDEKLYWGLVSSYAARKYGKTKHRHVVDVDGEQVSLDTISCTYEGGFTTGSAVIGLPGTGKSTGVSIAASRYPKAILHPCKEGHYIQIPIIRTTAYANSNMSSLFRAFAARLDMILDTGNAHRDQMPKTNIGQMCSQIIDWIQMYHIGCWIIEEISFFSFSSSSSSSFENIVTIMQETGIFVLGTGNNDFFDKITGNFRQERRLLADFINMDAVSKDRVFMKTYTELVWTRYLLPELRGLYSEDMGDIIYRWTLGSIDMLTILLVCIQKEYLRAHKKTPGMPVEDIVTPAFVEGIAKDRLARMTRLFKKGQMKSITEYKKLREEFDSEKAKDEQGSLIEDAKALASLEENIRTGYDSHAMLYKVREAVTMYTDEHTDKQIETAFYHCEKNIKGFKEMKVREMVRAVRAKLEERTRGKSKGKGTPAAAKAAPQDHGLLLEGLKGCMYDPAVQTTTS